MTTFSPTDLNITYIGRWATLNIGGVTTKSAISAGTRFRFGFTGTTVQLNFKVVTATTNYPEIEYIIDDGAPVRVEISSPTVSIAGLTSGSHTIEVWVDGVFYGANRWNTHEGVMLQGITLDSGAVLQPYPTNAKGKMLTVGDSIAEGLSVIAPLDGLPHSYYGRGAPSNRVGAALGLDNWNVAFGGSGFYGTNTDGSGVPETEVNYLSMMAGIPQQDPVFNIVLIEASNNDSNTKIDSTTFVSRYETLIDEIRTNSPNATIFCMGPISPYAPERQADVQTVANAKGCIYVNTSSWVVEFDSYNHPDLVGQQQIADYLQPILQPYVPKTTTQSLTTSAAVYGQGTYGQAAYGAGMFNSIIQPTVNLSASLPISTGLNANLSVETATPAELSASLPISVGLLASLSPVQLPSTDTSGTTQPTTIGPSPEVMVSGNVDYDTLNRVYRLFTTPAGSVPFDRNFGVDLTVLDNAPAALEGALLVEYAKKLNMYYPKLTISQLSFSYQDSSIIPLVVIAYA